MRRIAFLVPATLLLTACGGAPPAAPPPDRGLHLPVEAPPLAATPQRDGDRFAALVERFTDRAKRAERAGDPRQALDSWNVVAALRPEAADPKRRVADLTVRLAADAERHFRDGSARQRDGDIDGARRGFLLALAANPGHVEALGALRNLEQEAVLHTVAAGESLESIANQAYRDPAKAPLLARINDLDPAGKLKPGSILTLPLIAPPKRPPRKGTPESAAEPADSAYDTEPAAIGAESKPLAVPLPANATQTQPAPDPAEELLARARELYKANKFEEAGTTADSLADHPAVAPRARELSGNSWFAAGDAALKRDDLAQAAIAYQKALPARRDAAAALAAVERRKKEKAEELYTAGVRFFINQELDEAIRSWEQTLALNPGHPKAPRDIEKARALQQKLRELR
jgi:hypothetical protein